MLVMDMKRSEAIRSHRDRHPGLIDHLDNPHPLERKPVNEKPGRRAGEKSAPRTSGPR
jgi:hypothetical protein